MPFISDFELKTYIEYADSFYKYVKSQNNGVADFGSDENSLQKDALKFLYTNLRRENLCSEIAGHIDNVLLRPVDDDNLVLNLWGQNHPYYIRKDYYRENGVKKDYYFISPLDVKGAMSSFNISFGSSNNIPIDCQKIKKIQSDYNELSIIGSYLISYENFNFETNTAISLNGIKHNKFITYEHLNNCKIPKLILYGLNTVKGLDKIDPNNIPIIRIDDDLGRVSAQDFKLLGLTKDTIFNQDGSERVEFYSNSSILMNYFYGYAEIVKNYPDVYTDPLKERIYNRINTMIGGLQDSSTYLETFTRELQNYGYSSGNQPVDKVKNKLINILLK